MEFFIGNKEVHGLRLPVGEISVSIEDYFNVV